MKIHEVVGNVKAQLNTWKSTGLNEAQTSQVIILPVLQALNYEIWNPFEVCPQEVSNGNIPDYIVSSGAERRFIIEVKKLEITFNDTMKTQAVSYANNHAIRWAILINGNQWLLFDSFLVNKPAHERLVLELSIENLEINLMAQYLEQLLKAENWENAQNKIEKIAGDIANHIQLNNTLQPLANQLSKLMLEYTIQSLDGGLKLEEKLGIWSSFERTLVHNNLSIISKSLNHDSNSDNLEQAKTLTSKGNQLIEALKQGIKQTSALRRESNTTEFQAHIHNEETNAASWRDIHAGIAETFLILSKENELEENDSLYKTTEERKKGDGTVYPPSAYRKLSNERLLFLHASAEAHNQKSKKLLKILQFPKNTLKVTYKGKLYHLP